MSSDGELERLDALAEKVDEQFGSLESSASSAAADGARGSANMSDDEDEEDPDASLAAAAAVVPRKRRRIQQEQKGSSDDAEFFRGPTWRDMEEQHRFLASDHLERLHGLLDRLERGNVDEGDDVDLKTGLIVRSTGHLQALAPRADLDLFGEDEDAESEDIEDAESDDADAEGMNELLDPMFTVCQRPSLLLNTIVEATRQRWIL